MVWQAVRLEERNQARCSCMAQEQGHLVATKRRGIKRFVGTGNQANHGDPFRHKHGCPHSELQVTTKRNEHLKSQQELEEAAKKKAALKIERIKKRLAIALARCHPEAKVDGPQSR